MKHAEQEKRAAAIVTGASHGIGRAISEKLLVLGYEVYGFGRKFDGHKEPQQADKMSVRFHAIEGDLLNTVWMTAEIKEIMKKETQIEVLVNNAGCAWYGLHEEMSAQKIAAMVRTNLELPMILTQLLLRHLKENQGYVINIASVTAEEAAPRGVAYGATKAGLLSFSRSVFAENRKYGLKVTCILPDLTDTDLYRNADFRPSEDPGCALSPEDVASAVEYVLTQPAGMTVPELMLRPQKNRIERKKTSGVLPGSQAF